MQHDYIWRTLKNSKIFGFCQEATFGTPPVRVWHKKVFFRSSQKIHDVVFFNEKLTYCKTNETVFNQYFQKLGIPQGGNQMSPKL